MLLGLQIYLDMELFCIKISISLKKFLDTQTISLFFISKIWFGTVMILDK